MPGDLKPGTSAQPSVAHAARWPAGVLALSLAAMVVLWLHALALQGLAQALPGLGKGASTAPVTRAFITRTVQFDNGADKAPALATKPAAAAQPPEPKPARKPAGAAFLVAPEPPASEPAPIAAAAGSKSPPATAPEDSVAVADAARAPATLGPAEAASAPAAVPAASATATQAPIPAPAQAQAATQPVVPGALPTALANTPAPSSSLLSAGTGSAVIRHAAPTSNCFK